MAQLCADAVIGVLRGERPGNLVNRDVVSQAPWNRKS
jgi:hypothetical protein